MKKLFLVGIVFSLILSNQVYSNTSTPYTNELDDVIELTKSKPFFFISEWDNFKCTIQITKENSTYIRSSNSPIVANLEKAVTKLHEMSNNISNNFPTTLDTFVVGNGSMQLLWAGLMVAAKNKHLPLESPLKVLVTPYNTPCLMLFWLKEIIPITFVNDPNEADIEVITSPNLPDGTLVSKPRANPGTIVIVDGVYNWPIYLGNTPNVIEPTHNNPMLYIFSSSKLFGVPGARVGWGYTTTPSLATEIWSCINNNTIGCNSFGIEVLTKMIEEMPNSYIEDIKKVIADRRARFTEVFEKLGFNVKSSKGAYLYIQPPEELKQIMDEKKITSGELMLMLFKVKVALAPNHENEKYNFYIPLVCENDKTENVYNRLSKAATKN